ncbi:MAG: glycosyltransferase family 25 protein [bacterium]
MNINDYFDKIVCITLDERYDKEMEVKKRFDNLGIKVEWFRAVKYNFIPNIVKYLSKTQHSYFNEHQPYEIGAALSHYTVMKKALLEGHEKILVFEDDVLFQKDFHSKFEKYMEKAPEDWDMLMFYSFMYELLPENKKVSSRWIRSYKAWSLMSYAVTEHFMKEYIKRQDNFFTISDLVSYKMQEEGFKIYSAIPTLCIPNAESGSDIRKYVNYEKKPTVLNTGFSKDNFE